MIQYFTWMLFVVKVVLLLCGAWLIAWICFKTAEWVVLEVYRRALPSWYTSEENFRYHAKQKFDGLIFILGSIFSAILIVPAILTLI